MSAGVPHHVVINLQDLEAAFQPGEEVTLQALKDKRLLNPSGKAAKLPLKVAFPC
jgi:large subunit ribosomal protein L15